MGMMKRGRGKGTLNHQWSPRTALKDYLSFFLSLLSCVTQIHKEGAANVLCQRRHGKTVEQSVSTAGLMHWLDEVDCGHTTGSTISHQLHVPIIRLAPSSVPITDLISCPHSTSPYLTYVSLSLKILLFQKTSLKPMVLQRACKVNQRDFMVSCYNNTTNLAFSSIYQYINTWILFKTL